MTMTRTMTRMLTRTMTRTMHALQAARPALYVVTYPPRDHVSAHGTVMARDCLSRDRAAPCPRDRALARGCRWCCRRTISGTGSSLTSRCGPASRPSSPTPTSRSRPRTRRRAAPALALAHAAQHSGASLSAPYSLLVIRVCLGPCCPAVGEVGRRSSV